MFGSLMTHSMTSSQLMKPETDTQGEPRHIYTVLELNNFAKRILEGRLGSIWVTGEVSELTRARSGHTYFKIKDKWAVIDCVLFRQEDRDGSGNLLDNGKQVNLNGRVTVYSKSGRYQLVVRKVEFAGEGELLRAIEALKRKLKDEGLFDDSRKKSLPKFPKRVGVVTSPTGAAFQDIIRTFRRRSPSVELVLYPAVVQGHSAARDIVKAIRLADRHSTVQVLIVGRGGGSVEELMAFSDEQVAEAIFDCKIPVVSAVGHETDVPISDFVADIRAATPTAAAELVSSPSETDLKDDLIGCENALRHGIQRILEDLEQHVDLVQKGLVHPQTGLDNLQVRLEHLAHRIRSLVTEKSFLAAERFGEYTTRLMENSPLDRIRLSFQTVASNQKLLELHIGAKLADVNQAVKAFENRIEGVNPTSILKRGYSIIRRDDGNTIVRSVQSVDKGDNVTAQLDDGEIFLNVNERKVGKKAI